MIGIRDILAANLKECRRKQGITQEQFAEKAGVSSHYIAMIETRNTFPKPEMLERLAAALGIEAHELFSVEASPGSALEHLHRSILIDIKEATVCLKQIARQTIQETLAVNRAPKDTVEGNAG